MGEDGRVGSRRCLASDTAWEWNARANLGLHAGDIDDSPQAWAEQRRLADAAPVTLVGDSRILFDTDLDRFQPSPASGPCRRPSSEPTPARFSKAMRTTPNSTVCWSSAWRTQLFPARGRRSWGLLSQGFREERQTLAAHGIVARPLPPALFRIPRFRVSAERSAKRFDHGIRPVAYGPYDDVWKISEDVRSPAIFHVGSDRDGPYLRAHARYAWNVFKGPPLPPFIARNVIARSAEAVRRIRARGGDVIFVRPPSAPELRAVEDKRLPRAKGWDMLLAATQERVSTPMTCRRRKTSSFPNGHTSATNARPSSPTPTCAA